jgi:hypothetical protein
MAGITPELLKRIRENDPTLTSISLGYNQISDAGAKDLAEALKVNKTLTSMTFTTIKSAMQLKVMSRAFATRMLNYIMD